MWKQYKYKDLTITRVSSEYDNGSEAKLYIYLGEDVGYLSKEGTVTENAVDGWFKTKKKARKAIDKYLKSIGKAVYYEQ